MDFKIDVILENKSWNAKFARLQRVIFRNSKTDRLYRVNFGFEI